MPEIDAAQDRRLDAKLAGGVAWTAGAKWVTQVFTFGFVFITARLLSDTDYGISNMASSFYLITTTLAEFGVGTAVMQMRELPRHTLAQLHTFSLAVCALIFLASIPAAPWIATFFHTPVLTPVIILCNASFLITGIVAVPNGLLQQDMDYRRLSLAEAIQAPIQAITMVTLAYLHFRYWSLVCATMLARLCGCILVCKWKPVEFAIPKWSDLRPPLTMGGQTAIGRLATTAYAQSDGIVVGRVLNSALAGVYGMAMTMAVAPAEKISSLIMRATGPLFAHVQDDHESGQRYFLILTELLMLIELPMMIGLGIVAPDAVPVALGKGWSGVVWPLRFLVLFMPVRTLRSLMDQVLVSKRRTRFTMIMSLADFVLMPIAFVVGAHWRGTAGVAAAWIVLSPITFVPMIFTMMRSIHLTPRRFLTAIAPAVSGVAAMSLALLALRRSGQIDHLSTLVRLISQVGLGGLVYAAFELVFFRARLLRYMQFLRSFRERRRAAAASVSVA